MADSAPPPPGTRLVPLGVPQVHAYPIALKNIYFVRYCYEECYDEVCSAIETGKTLINVTGTPGIGKSVFYMYVLQRFQEEKDDIKKIITASYDDGKELERKIWIRGENDDSDDFRKPFANDEEDCKYYLYDGVPDHPPTEPEKGRIMICFSSPNTVWLRKLRRRPMEYAECYMPGWAIDELRTANVALGWGVTDEDLVRRWKHFGGTAHFILGHADVETYGMAEFKDALNKIQSLDDVLDFFQKGGGHPEKVIHRLLHFDVKKFRVLNAHDFPALKPGTDYVGFKISEKLNVKLDDERKKLMNWLDGHGKPATFLGWLFENYAHEKLLGGVTLQLHDLATGAASEETFSETQGHYQRFSVSLPLSQALLEAYRSPDAQNLRSIDSYKLHNGTLWLFQITRNMDHAVHTEGILDLLKHLRLLETFLAGKTTVKLLFIVPARLESTFPQQVHEIANVYKAEASLADVYSYGCESVPGIGPNKKLKLEGSGIRTVRELLGAYDENDASVSLVRKTVEDFKAVLEARTALMEIAKIPQFVAGLNYYYSNDTAQKKMENLRSSIATEYGIEIDPTKPFKGLPRYQLQLCRQPIPLVNITRV